MDGGTSDTGGKDAALGGPSGFPAHVPPSGGMKFLFGFGRMMGFTLLAAPAMAIIAAVVLLPAYQRMEAKVYLKECARQDNQTYKNFIAARDEMIKHAPEDVNLTREFTIAYEGKLPRNEVVVVDPSAPPPPVPGTIAPRYQDRPAPPGNLLLTMADKIAQPNTRRGLFLLATLAILGAMFLFAPEQTYVEPPAASAESR